MSDATDPLLVVSNRLSLPDQVQIGGLAGALGGALGASGGTWIGWSGQIGSEGFHRRIGPVEYDAVDLDRRTYDGYYVGFSNRVLWPLMHSRLDLMEYGDGDRDAYFAANGLFADRIVAALQPRSRIWIHDYHLFRWPRCCANAGCASASASSCTRRSRRPTSRGRCRATNRCSARCGTPT